MLWNSGAVLLETPAFPEENSWYLLSAPYIEEQILVLHLDGCSFEQIDQNLIAVFADFADIGVERVEIVLDNSFEVDADRPNWIQDHPYILLEQFAADVTFSLAQLDEDLAELFHHADWEVVDVGTRLADLPGYFGCKLGELGVVLRVVDFHYKFENVEEGGCVDWLCWKDELQKFLADWFFCYLELWVFLVVSSGCPVAFHYVSEVD